MSWRDPLRLGNGSEGSVRSGERRGRESKRQGVDDKTAPGCYGVRYV